MRLIDADLIIELLEKEKARDDCRGGWYSTVCSIIRLLKAAPTVTLGEVFKDEEVHKPDYSYEADLIKRKAKISYYDVEDGTIRTDRTDRTGYCKWKEPK